MFSASRPCGSVSRVRRHVLCNATIPLFLVSRPIAADSINLPPPNATFSPPPPPRAPHCNICPPLVSPHAFLESAYCVCTARGVPRPTPETHSVSGQRRNISHLFPHILNLLLNYGVITWRVRPSVRPTLYLRSTLLWVSTENSSYQTFRDYLSVRWNRNVDK